MADTELGKGGFDPFADRLTSPSSITDLQTLMHLIKAALGSGILSLPIAFYYSGIFLGILTTMVTALICGHCAYVLVKCAHFLYYKEKKTQLTYAEVSEMALMGGPKCAQMCAKCLKYFVIYGLLITYFGTCSVYTVIVAKNVQQVLEYYTDETYSDRLLIVLFLIPLILLTYIPNLRKLAPVSMVANIFIGSSILVTAYYCVIDLPPISDRVYMKFDELPNFFSITIFAMEAIGMIMPLENSMKTPTHFLGYFGILTQGMLVLAGFCAGLGFLGYWRYGDDTAETITLNIPNDEWPAQIVKLLIALAMYCTFGLQFTVCLEITWNGVKEQFPNNPLFGNYLVRTILVVSAVALAAAVPTIAPFMGLIGAFCFSICGLMIPVIIETIICLDSGFGIGLWILWKNIFIMFFGLFALIFGSYDAIGDISKIYD